MLPVGNCHVEILFAFSGRNPAAVGTSFDLPPRYGGSESSSVKEPSVQGEKPKKRLKRPAAADADHAPLGAGSGKDDDDEEPESDDLDGLDGLLNLGDEGGPKKRPAASTKGSQKKPATSKRGAKKQD